MTRQLLVVCADRPGTFPTISAALGQAAEGAMISVLPGRYRESLVLDRMVTIAAEDGAGSVTIEATEGPVVTVAAEAAALRDVTVTCASPDVAAIDVPFGEIALDNCTVLAHTWAALMVRGSGRLVLRGCEVTNDAGAGIVVVSASANTVENTTLRDLQSSAVVVTDHGKLSLRRCVIRTVGGNGICANGNGTVTVDQCEITGVQKPAVVVEERAAATMARVTVRESESLDLYLASLGAISLENSTFAGGGIQAAHIADRSEPQLRRCTFTGATRNAVAITGGASPRFVDCTIAESPAGIVVDASSAPRFETLVIRDTTHGAVLVAGGSDIELTRLRVSAAAGPAVAVKGRSRFTASDVDIEVHGAVGIDLSESARLALHDARITADIEVGLTLADGAQATLTSVKLHGGGVVVAADAQAEIRDSEIVECLTDGVRVEAGGTLTAARSRVRSCGRHGCMSSQRGGSS